MSLPTGKTPDSFEENNSAMYPNRRYLWCQLGVAIALAISGAIAREGDRVIAQIVPDATLGAESSVVTPQTPGSNVDLIQGGATRGANLFHSFEQFSVLTRREAFFNNALDMQNIISRVTGASSSNIDGLIRANGTANLFLINPNGIIFGPNASLAIGGSFVGSTASSVNFTDGSLFSATAPQTMPLLTIGVPLGLQFAGTTESIVNQSRATNSSGGVGLQVLPGETLTLLGGDVRLDGGNLFAPGGRLELGGVVEPGTVELNVDSSLSFPVGVQLSDVSITNGAVVNVSAITSGSIAINARNLDILGGSRLLANREPGLGVNTQAGNITLNATEGITVANDSLINTDVLDGAKGNGGSINIATGSLWGNDGARLSAGTFGRGDAGSVTINARYTVSLNGVSTRRSGLFSRVESTGVGEGGDINVMTGSLSVINGARLVANTYGQGNAGSLTINARDTISLYGVDINGRLPLASGVFSEVEGTDAVGNGGDINVTTGSLFATDGARLNTNSNGQGNAGSVTINARDTVSFDGVLRNNSGGVFSRVEDGSVGNGGNINVTTGSLFATNGARLSAESTGQGNAGDIIINAHDRVFLDGVGRNRNRNSSGVFGGVSIPPSNSSIINESSPGQGGNLTINTGQLIVQNNAEVNVNTNGSGAAGNLEVAARSIRLENQASLSSDTTAGQGNINLRSGDVVLRRGSNITTDATGTATGGNITIDTDNLVALENSDIRANAVESFGGEVIINAQGIFGTQFREGETLESDITAISAAGPQFSGIVELNTPQVDPSRGLINLPAELVDASNQIAAGCAAGSESLARNEFTITGRGGLPPSPSEALRSDPVQVDLGAPIQSAENSASTAIFPNLTRVSVPDQIVEAQGWVIAADGEVILTANAPTVTPHIPILTPAFCNGS